MFRFLKREVAIIEENVNAMDFNVGEKMARSLFSFLLGPESELGRTFIYECGIMEEEYL